MQKGEWLPFSRRFSFYILHSAFCISTLGQGEGEWDSRRFHGLRISETISSLRNPKSERWPNSSLVNRKSEIRLTRGSSEAIRSLTAGNRLQNW